MQQDPTSPSADELLRRALALAPEEREAFLARECPDPELRARVRGGLERARAGRTVVEVLPSSSGGGGEGPGTSIGRYRLREHLGEGGFGSVWLAEQEEPVVRQVALKIVKLGMDTRQVIARFEAERQALALMDHPAIARVLDGGATEAGRPYFVMELVRGVAITDYCDRHGLAPRERLALFAEVCGAVHHAHQKGIVHRDIKPSNVMVALHEGKPVPKVIDFGIAKALHGRLTERTLHTEQRQVIGTPAYMSPEQAERSGLDVDTRTDVYSLGVLLYELLTGTTPFDVRALDATDLEGFRRLVREHEPPRPSVRVTTGDSSEIARRRRADPRSLVRMLRGDLDWIVMKALEKDRSRRYDSAAALADDVRRHLAGEPVLASPPSATYRAAKFVRRHRLAVGAALAVAVALVAGVIGTAAGLAQAVHERERAEERAREAEAVTGFLVGMLESVQPDGSGRDVTVRELLDEASADVSAFAERPAVEARVRQALGVTYLELGRLDEAEEHLVLSADLLRRHSGADSPDALKALANLAALRIEQGREAEAEGLLGTALDGFTRALGADDPRTLGVLSNLAVLRARHAADDETVALHRRVLEGQRRALGPEHPDTLGAQVNLAGLLADVGRADEAERLLRDATEAWARAHGAAHPGTLLAETNLAMLESRLGRHDPAEERLRRVIEARERVHGPRHAETLAALANLGFVLRRASDVAGAEEAWTEAWEGLRIALGDGHPTTTTVAGQLFTLFQSQGWPASARPLAERLLVSLVASADDPALGPQDLNRIAWTLVAEAPPELLDPAKALGLAQRACSLERARGGGRLWMYLDTLAAAQHATGDTAAALATQREALETMPASDAPRFRGELEERLRAYEAAAGRPGSPESGATGVPGSGREE